MENALADRLFDAVIFDLDGVITHTATLHIRAWKEMFDEYLELRSERENEPFHPFTEQDYYAFVDGKPRIDGILSFLDSREIELSYGNPVDSPHEETIHGLGNRKNVVFNQLVKTEGVTVFPSSVVLIEALKKQNVKVGVASSSKNCRNILDAVGLLEHFDVRIDGGVSGELGLKGKPAPDIFTTACDRLGVEYHRTVVVEDAVSGVQAGEKGRFGLVLGVAREIDPVILLKNGADIVVRDLDEIGIQELDEWFATGLETEQWSLTYHDYDQSKEKTREALLTVGNGYLGTRGAMEESLAGDIHYPGTYIAGVYNRLKSVVNEREIENEDFVNVPNWLPVNFYIDEEPLMDIQTIDIETICRRLDFKTGILHREMVVVDGKGRKTRIVSERLASMDDPHICALRYSLTPLNYQEKITIALTLGGASMNQGVARYNELNQLHLEPVGQDARENFLLVRAQTTTSGTEIAMAAAINVSAPPIETLFPGTSARKAEVRFSLSGRINQTVSIEKKVAVYTSLDPGMQNPADAAKAAVNAAPSFESIKRASILKWEQIWAEIDMKLDGDRFSQKILRLHMYHLLVTASPNNINIDSGFPARGLHGEAYRGHIFWDEIFILPFYDLHFPNVAKAILMYRYRRLNEARTLARAKGYHGAMYPWQSGSSGREETQVMHLNPLTGKWGPDHSSLQYHVSLSVAFNTWQYFHITGDIAFMETFGAEMFFEICRFWADMATWRQETGRYHIEGVMGPDEFHEKYPGSESGGMNDNAYTNLMVHWAMVTAREIHARLSNPAKGALHAKIGVCAHEIDTWQNIASRLNIVIQDDIIAQFDGYFSLNEIDWDYYRRTYGDIHRMDRILKKEGKSPNEYKVSKQADVLMAFFILGPNEVKRFLEVMGYKPVSDFFEKNINYYEARTSHGSTLSSVVHAALAAKNGDEAKSWTLYQEALASDYADVQGGTTGEGIHTGVMAGTVISAMTVYGGLKMGGETPQANPILPKLWNRLGFGIWFQNIRYEFEITKDEAVVRKKIDIIKRKKERKYARRRVADRRKAQESRR